MTNIVDMTSVTEGDTFSLKDSGIEVNENKFDIESIGDPENPSKFEITDTKTGKVFTVNADALTGGDYHQVIRHTDDTIPKKDIKRYRQEEKWLIYKSLVYKITSFYNYNQNLQKSYKAKYKWNTKIVRHEIEKC